MDRLCEGTRGKHTAVTCFYFNFAARKEQITTSMLGSLLRQAISGIEGFRRKYHRPWESRERPLVDANCNLVRS